MTAEDRPVHLEINCATGAVTHTVLTDSEMIEYHRTLNNHLDQADRKAAEDASLAEAVSAHPDPVVQALARRAGIL